MLFWLLWSVRWIIFIWFELCSFFWRVMIGGVSCWDFKGGDEGSEWIFFIKWGLRFRGGILLWFLKFFSLGFELYNLGFFELSKGDVNGEFEVCREVIGGGGFL